MQQVEEFEKFINEKLQVDLKTVLDNRDKLYEQISQYLELRNRILVLQQQLPPSSSTATKKPDHSSSSSEQESSCVVKTMVNLGSEFYAQAKLENNGFVFVNVGLGFYVQFTFEEALQFIKLKEALLQRYAEDATKKAAQIKAQIKVMYQGISELMKLDQLQQQE